MHPAFPAKGDRLRRMRSTRSGLWMSDKTKATSPCLLRPSPCLLPGGEWRAAEGGRPYGADPRCHRSAEHRSATCLPLLGRTEGVCRSPTAQKHPEGLCPRGVALRISLCRVWWDGEPSPVPLVSATAQKHPEDVCPRGAVLWIQLCRVWWAGEPSPVP